MEVYACLEMFVMSYCTDSIGTLRYNGSLRVPRNVCDVLLYRLQVTKAALYFRFQFSLIALIPAWKCHLIKGCTVTLYFKFQFYMIALIPAWKWHLIKGCTVTLYFRFQFYMIALILAWQINYFILF
jgi:hypothetical protein